MDILPCPTCQTPIYPEACVCAQGHGVVYDPDAAVLGTLDTAPPCAHRDTLGCSWRAETPGGLCLSCTMTTVVPDLSHPKAAELWATTEAAKRWVLLGLVRLGWFTGEADRLPEFELLSERVEGQRAQVMMGHLSGVITLNIMEADPAVAYKRKDLFDEPIRNMVGHLRHEIAHFLFECLAEDEPGFLPAFRNLMGDEREDYGEALTAYYETGAPQDWQDTHISAYATAHAHEAWAEHAAHAMHLHDIAHAAAELGLTLQGDTVLDRAQTAGIMLNHLSRSLGQPDPYPMVISPEVRQKIEFCLAWLNRSGRAGQMQGFARFRSWLNARALA